MKQNGQSIRNNLPLKEILKAVLDKKAAISIKARGPSMSPFIKDGDIITIYPLEETLPIKRGDVVAAIGSFSNKLFVHRVVSAKRNAFLLKGDNNRSFDGLFTKGHILGRVKAIERNNKSVFFGLGLERLLIALLSKCGLLKPALNTTMHLKHSFHFNKKKEPRLYV